MIPETDNFKSNAIKILRPNVIIGLIVLVLPSI